MSNGGGGSHTALQKEREQAMPGSDDKPHEVDLSKPNVARMPPDDDPYGVVARFRDALCPGSFLVLSHVTGDGREPGALTGIDDVYGNANAPLIMRTREQVTAFFNGFDLIEPGIVFLSQWRPTGEYYAQRGRRWRYCGLGKKP